METIKTVDDFLYWRKNQSGSVGFTPTLGALHKGHLSLIYTSKKQCDLSVVSIFLNPTQFAANEDLDCYPNTLDSDIKILEDLYVDILFLPNEEEMYVNVQDVNIPPSGLFEKLEGELIVKYFPTKTSTWIP